MKIQPPFLKIGVFVLILAFYGSFLVYKITLPGAQDLPRQMKNGEMVWHGNFEVITKNVYSYTEPNQPFANHHWLYGVFAHLIHAVAGYTGMVVFKVFFILFTFALLFYVALKKADFWLVSVLSIPTIAILINRSALRPEAFSYFFVTLFLYLLTDLMEHPTRKRIFWLIPLQVIWVNTHLFFGVGILLVGGFLFEQVVLNFKNLKENPLVKKLAVLFVGVVAAIFLNAYGLMGAIYSLRVNTNADFPISSAEINSIWNVLRSEPSWDNVSAKFFMPLAIILAFSFIGALLFRRKKKQPLLSNNFLFYFLASIGSAGLSFFVIRGLPLFGFIFFLAMINNCNGMYIALKEKLKEEWPRAARMIGKVLIIVLAFILVGLAIFSQQTIMKDAEEGLGLARFSLSSANFFKNNDLKGPVFNDTDIGSYLIGELYPQEKVFVDNRFGDAYSASFFRDIYLSMLRDEDKWKEGLGKYKFNTIFFYHYDAVDGARNFLYRRIFDPEWAWIYADQYAVILVRNNAENQDIIKKFQITSDNIVDKLKYLIDSGDEIAVADLYNLIGRFDLSMPLYLKIVSQAPGRGKVWMVLGRNELTKDDLRESNPYIAAIFLERAIEKGWKTWESYSYLALAYFRTGQLDRAEEAVKQELRIDPENNDAKRWVGIIAKAKAEK